MVTPPTTAVARSHRLRRHTTSHATRIAQIARLARPTLYVLTTATVEARHEPPHTHARRMNGNLLEPVSLGRSLLPRWRMTPPTHCQFRWMRYHRPVLPCVPNAMPVAMAATATATVTVAATVAAVIATATGPVTWMMARHVRSLD